LIIIIKKYNQYFELIYRFFKASFNLGLVFASYWILLSGLNNGNIYLSIIELSNFLTKSQSLLINYGLHLVCYKFKSDKIVNRN
jgi:hypothetical protein